jgi:hypothetical protein
MPGIEPSARGLVSDVTHVIKRGLEIGAAFAQQSS